MCTESWVGGRICDFKMIKPKHFFTGVKRLSPTAKQQHRLESFTPEQINANGRYSYRTETPIDVTECKHNG